MVSSRYAYFDLLVFKAYQGEEETKERKGSIKEVRNISILVFTRATEVFVIIKTKQYVGPVLNERMERYAGAMRRLTI